MADFSGYIAADELYDGPYGVLSIVDNHRFRRLVYEVLDHNPTEEDILRFFRRFHEALTARGLTLKGITTDGSPLYPAAIVEVFGPVEHQVCEFHVLAELTKAILKAVTQVRRQCRTTFLPRTRHRFERHRPSRDAPPCGAPLPGGGVRGENRREQGLRVSQSCPEAGTDGARRPSGR